MIIRIISSLGSFISTIPMRPIGNISDYLPILLNILSSANELLRADEDKNVKNSKLFIAWTQCISFHIECHHQGAFMSLYLSQIVSYLFAINRYSNSLGKNLRITLEDILTSIPTTIEPRILLSVLLQFPNEYQKIISLIVGSSAFVTLDSLILLFLTEYFFFDYQRTDFYTQFVNWVLLILRWTPGIFVLLYCYFKTLNVLFSLIFHALSHQTHPIHIYKFICSMVP